MTLREAERRQRQRAQSHKQRQPHPAPAGIGHNRPPPEPSARNRSKRVLSFKDWCALNGISPQTGRRLIAAGKVKVTQLSERRIGIREDHNEEFQESCLRGGE
jgi:hypothetical protein